MAWGHNQWHSCAVVLPYYISIFCTMVRGSELDHFLSDFGFYLVPFLGMVINSNVASIQFFCFDVFDLLKRGVAKSFVLFPSSWGGGCSSGKDIRLRVYLGVVSTRQLGSLDFGPLMGHEARKNESKFFVLVHIGDRTTEHSQTRIKSNNAQLNGSSFLNRIAISYEHMWLY